MSESRLAESRFNMGRVVSQTFGVIARNPVSILLLCLLGTMASVGLGYLIRLAFSGQDATTQQVVDGALGIVVGTAVQSFLTGTTLFIAIADLNSQRASFSAAVAVGLRTLLPLTVITLLAVVGVSIGMILLLVPGIYLALRWAVVVAVRVVEGPGIGSAFSRSAMLTKGHRWAILGLVIAYVVLFGLLSFAVIMIDGGLQRAAVAQAQFDPVAVVLQIISGTINVAVSTSGLAAIYTELRRIKEGALPSQLAAVFE